MPALCQNGLHVTCAIKEEKKDEERVGGSKAERERRLVIWGIKKREGWQTEREEEKTREEVQRGLVFLFFHFCLREYRERTL